MVSNMIMYVMYCIQYIFSSKMIHQRLAILSLRCSPRTRNSNYISEMLFTRAVAGSLVSVCFSWCFSSSKAYHWP